MSTVRFTQTRQVAASVDDAYLYTLRTPVPVLFDRGFGPLPPVTGVDQQGEPAPWGTAGQVRILHTKDGSSMREELREVVAPEAFRYRITAFTGPLGKLAKEVAGEYAFTTTPEGTQARWTWVITPASALARVLLPVVGLMWKGYAAKALERIDQGTAGGASSP